MERTRAGETDRTLGMVRRKKVVVLEISDATDLPHVIAIRTKCFSPIQLDHAMTNPIHFEKEGSTVVGVAEDVAEVGRLEVNVNLTDAAVVIEGEVIEFCRRGWKCFKIVQVLVFSVS